MYKGTPYVNKHVKKREQERSMDYHKVNLNHVRPVTGTLEGGINDGVVINNRKGEMQKQTRFTEIERENRILLQKISSIMSKPKSKSTAQHPKFNKSLNSSFRRRQHQNIQVQNAKLLKRLQQKKPNYETQKFKQDWRRQKYVIKNLSNYPFIISDKKKHSKRSPSHVSNNISSSIELCRVRVIDGISFLITVRMNSARLQIVGDSKDKKEVKVIEIQRNQAVQFLEQECEGKMQLIFQRLRYDKEEEVLYLIGTDVQMEQLKQDTEKQNKTHSQRFYNPDSRNKGKEEKEEQINEVNKEFFQKNRQWVKVENDQLEENQEQYKEQEEDKKQQIKKEDSKQELKKYTEEKEQQKVEEIQKPKVEEKEEKQQEQKKEQEKVQEKKVSQKDEVVQNKDEDKYEQQFDNSEQKLKENAKEESKEKSVQREEVKENDEVKVQDKQQKKEEPNEQQRQDKKEQIKEDNPEQNVKEESVKQEAKQQQVEQVKQEQVREQEIKDPEVQ